MQKRKERFDFHGKRKTLRCSVENIHIKKYVFKV